MQEEVTQRTVALCVEATKLSAGMLQQAMKKVLDEMQKGVTGHMLYKAFNSLFNSLFKWKGSVFLPFLNSSLDIVAKS